MQWVHLSPGSNLLQATGVDRATSQLVDDLHRNTWLTVAKVQASVDDIVARARKGARQGCKIDAPIFDVIYEYALAKVRKRAKSEGLLYDVVGGEPCCWTPNEGAVLPEPTVAMFGRICSPSKGRRTGGFLIGY